MRGLPCEGFRGKAEVPSQGGVGPFPHMSDSDFMTKVLNYRVGELLSLEKPSGAEVGNLAKVARGELRYLRKVTQKPV